MVGRGILGDMGIMKAVKITLKPKVLWNLIYVTTYNVSG